MSIILNQFGGMVPKLDGRNLPVEAAQQAHNVNLAGGKLAPINVPGPFQVQHDPATGKMKSMIPAGNIISVNEPAAPIIADRLKLCRPSDWPGTQFNMGMWITYFDAAGVSTTTGMVPDIVPGSGEWEYTDDGVIWRATVTSKSFSAQPGLYYYVHGLKWGISFDADTKYYGGPDQDHNFSVGNLSASSPEWPDFSMPLTAPIDYTGFDDAPGDGGSVYTGERYTYGHLQLVSVNAPRPVLPYVDMTAISAATTVTLIESGKVEFIFKCNYQRNTQIFVNYVSTAVDQRVAEGAANQALSGTITKVFMKDIEYGDTEVPASGTVRLTNAANQTEDIAYTSYGIVSDIYQFTVNVALTYAYAEDDDIIVIDATTVGKEGPASDLSELTTVDPGDLLKLTTTRPTGYNRQKLYRSSSDADFRVLDDELEADTYIDTFIENLGATLPPNGNYPQSTLALAMEGSVVLGGHTAMIFDDNEVRPSEPYKQWVYPEEYAFPLDAPFLAAASFGSSAVVFTDTNTITDEVGKVFLFSGQNPAYLSRLEIAADKPLLNKRSLCVIDSTAYYATTDGLCAVSPGGIQILTEGFFTRSQWLAYKPALMSAYTADNSIFIIGLADANPIHFRFDLGEGGLAAFTTYDAFSDADMYWKSKKFQEQRPKSNRNLQVLADGYPVEITLIGDDGVVNKSVLVPSERSVMLPRTRKCRDWEVEVRGRSTVSRVAIADSIQELNT